MSSHHQTSSSVSSVAGVSALLHADPAEAAKAADVASSSSANKSDTAVAVGGLGPNVLKATKAQRFKHHQVVLPANGLQFGFSSVQGLRDHMEDATVIASSLSGDLSAVSYVAVYDGHGGHYASDYASKHLLPVLLANPRIKDALSNPLPRANAEVIKDGFIACDTLLREKLDGKGLQGRTGERRAGTTAATAFITPRYVIMANAGDSRALLVRSSSVYQISHDHSPLIPSERDRVEAAGSFVSQRGRIHDNLNVSRGLGDHGHKDNPALPLQAQAVSPEPDVHVITRSPGHDQFLVVGSDGLFEALTNKDVGSFVLKAWKDAGGDMQKLTEGLVDHALESGSRDNVTAIVVAFTEGAFALLHAGASSSSSSSSSSSGSAAAGAGQPRHSHPEDEPGSHYRGERGDPKMR